MIAKPKRLKRISDATRRQRFLNRCRNTHDPDACWEWTGAVDRNGYGVVRVGQWTGGAHRAAYALLVGDIPAGYHVHHKCRNRACCNPRHLELVTVEDHRYL